MGDDILIVMYCSKTEGFDTPIKKFNPSPILDRYETNKSDMLNSFDSDYSLKSVTRELYDRFMKSMKRKIIVLKRSNTQRELSLKKSESNSIITLRLNHSLEPRMTDKVKLHNGLFMRVLGIPLSSKLGPGVYDHDRSLLKKSFNSNNLVSKNTKRESYLKKISKELSLMITPEKNIVKCKVIIRRKEKDNNVIKNLENDSYEENCNSQKIRREKELYKSIKRIEKFKQLIEKSQLYYTETKGTPSTMNSN